MTMPDMSPPAADAAANQQQAPSRSDMPVAPTCCDTLGSCTVTFAIAEASSSQPMLGRIEIPQSVTIIPFSERAAPDTPPPKA
jgi:hypothetical protein